MLAILITIILIVIISIHLLRTHFLCTYHVQSTETIVVHPLDLSILY